MGPAIRRAISQALAGMMQSVNQALEHTLSLKGLAWRWEAVRTGTSFAEVVLRHSLLYRVEQVFLVHRESGLLLQHLTAPSIAAQPPDMVAGMLTAIQDFARDSFQVDQEDMLETMQVGDLTVRVEQGVRALLAAVIRGQAPPDFRAEMQEALEAIEGAHASELAGFEGDASPFARSRPRLEALLLMEAREPARRPPWRTWLLFGAAAVLLAALLVPRVIRDRRWHQYLNQLRDEPGVIVTDAGRQDGRYVVRGLRDPLARDPARLLGAFRLPGDAVIGRWEPYVALLPQFILSRAARALAPPAAIALQLVADTLVARGAATDAWFERASLLAPALPGVGTFVAERLAPRDLPALAPLVAAVESRRILFPSGLAAVDSTAAPTAEGIIADLRRLDSAASGLGFRVRAGVVGSADDIGSEEQNDRLRIERADRVRAYLLPQLPAAVGLWAAAAAPDTIPATSDAERAARRAVTVVVELAGSVGGVPGRP
jgi:OOP family OmpA-OmpF porin